MNNKMIFITLGSQKFQFNRLLKKVDELVQKEKIQGKVFAQIGHSDYKPQNYEYKEFLDREEFKEMMKSSELVITHGGTGAIITGLKNNKKVIAVPRLSKYGEHVDDHQMQIVEEFGKTNIIEAVYDVDKLEESIANIHNKEFEKYISNTQKIIDSIEKFIEENSEGK